MKWRIEFEKSARDTLAKLDKPIRQQIEKYLDNLLTLDDPRMRGKGLTGDKAGQWRYRAGDYRIICEIRDNVLVILVLSIGHRSKVYK
ncbi:MAG: type II toxin-antitoxin system RelE/ParE family toxin [Synergistaceae bacterium]|nr:type II toxin-antitoxin system RelE/ParE family toxin [Synergistaceae bacterium]